MAAIFDRVNQSEYLYLRSIRDMGINQLELLIEEAIVNESRRGSLARDNQPAELAFLYADAAPIESVPGCKVFRFFWKLYVAFLVTEECAGSCGNYEHELYEGRSLRIYSRSHFLDYLQLNTGGHSQPLLHYKIICGNHLIDVASVEPPEVEIMEFPVQLRIQ
jgi:hypothetical protein